MERRTFLKMLGLSAGTIAGASCAPKGAGEMDRFGDILGRLAQGQPLTSGEIERLRLLGNQQQGIVSQMGTMLTPNGNLDPNIFSHHSSEFSVLPHESASMVNFNENQAIPNTTHTVLTFKAEADMSAEEKRFSWQHGIKINPATGEVSLKGIPDESIWLVNYEVHWENAPSAAVVVSVYETGTAYGHGMSDDAYSLWDNQIGSFQMETHQAASTLTLRAWQMMGSTKNVASAMLQVTRLR